MHMMPLYVLTQRDVGMDEVIKNGMGPGRWNKGPLCGFSDFN